MSWQIRDPHGLLYTTLLILTPVGWVMAFVFHAAKNIRALFPRRHRD